jgi:chromosome segregation ATPase
LAKAKVENQRRFHPLHFNNSEVFNQLLRNYHSFTNFFLNILEENQTNISSLALQKSDLESELGTLKREIDSLEGSKQRANDELNSQRQVLDNLR